MDILSFLSAPYFWNEWVKFVIIEVRAELLLFMTVWNPHEALDNGFSFAAGWKGMKLVGFWEGI